MDNAAPTSTQLKRHPEFYREDQMMVFEAWEGILNIPSDVSGDSTEVHPIKLDGIVTLKEMEALLKWLDDKPVTGEAVLIAMLKMSHIWMVDEMRQYAIDGLGTIRSNPAQRLELCQLYGHAQVSKWVMDAVGSLVIMFTTIQFNSSMLRMLWGSDEDNDPYPAIAKARETIESQRRLLDLFSVPIPLLTLIPTIETYIHHLGLNLNCKADFLQQLKKLVENES
ncbi:hypothetical protein C8J56DRAFT_900519 [Mycena floridula]|nr:hypothetical protein C8J56DRAFT_900519 [Mycena floridula]